MSHSIFFSFSLICLHSAWRAVFYIRPRRKFQIAVEALFMIDFPTLKHKFSFFLDRKQMRITLDVASNSIIHSKHFNVANINETSIIRSLAFQFHENAVTLYVDCVEQSKLEIDIGLSKLYLQMDDPIIKLFRERKYPLHFDTAIPAAFNRANCQKGQHKHGNKRYNRNRQSERGKVLTLPTYFFYKENIVILFTFFRYGLQLLLICYAFSFVRTEKNKKRDIRNWYQSVNDRYLDTVEDKNRDDLRRGDIPILHGDCDGMFFPYTLLFFFFS